MFQINQDDGTLKQLGVMNDAATAVRMFFAFAPSGKTLYAVDQKNNLIRTYTINSLKGTLTPAVTPTIATGTDPHGITVTSTKSGDYVYVTNYNHRTARQGSISMYKIDSLTNDRLVANINKDGNNQYYSDGKTFTGLDSIVANGNKNMVYALDYARSLLYAIPIQSDGKLGTIANIKNVHDYPSDLKINQFTGTLYYTPSGECNLYGDFIRCNSSSPKHLGYYPVNPDGTLVDQIPTPPETIVNPLGMVIW